MLQRQHTHWRYTPELGIICLIKHGRYTQTQICLTNTHRKGKLREHKSTPVAVFPLFQCVLFADFFHLSFRFIFFVASSQITAQLVNTTTTRVSRAWQRGRKDISTAAAAAETDVDANKMNPAIETCQ